MTITICMTRGYHFMQGVGTGTSMVVWADHCRDCGAPLTETR